MPDCNSTHVPGLQGRGPKVSVQSKQFKVQKGQGKSKIEKPPSPKIALPISMKKSKDGNDAEATATVSNGLAAPISRAKQPNKSRSSNGPQVQLSDVSINSNIWFLFFCSLRYLGTTTTLFSFDNFVVSDHFI